ncbi:MAG: hypothetical protein IK016_03830 [Lachnospiraceae bacterium]|nr:hypothetical protein [Lachnospiraceae bacterium]
MDEHFGQQEENNLPIQTQTPPAGGFMSYSEEESVYDDAAHPFYTVRPQEETSSGGGKGRIAVMLLSILLCVVILVSGVLFAAGKMPFLSNGNEAASDDASTEASEENPPSPTGTVTIKAKTLSMERKLLVFRIKNDDGTQTVMEYAYDTIAAPDGPAPLTKALAEESTRIEETLRAEPASQGQLSYDDLLNVSGFDVYQKEAYLSVARADDLVVSILQTQRINHGFSEFDLTYYQAFNLDRNTGEVVKANRIIADSKAFYEVLLRLLEEDPGRKNILSLKEEIRKDLQKLAEEGPVFTMEEGGIRVYFSSNTLGQGLIGACEVFVPFAGNEKVFVQNDYTSPERINVPMRLTQSPMKEEIYDLTQFLEEYDIQLKINRFREMSGIWRKDGQKDSPYLRMDQSGFLDYYSEEGVMQRSGFLEASSSGREGEYDYYAFPPEKAGTALPDGWRDREEPYEEWKSEEGAPVLAGSVLVTGPQTLVFTLDGVSMLMIFDSPTE